MKVAETARKKTAKGLSRKGLFAKSVAASTLSHRHQSVLIAVQEGGLLAEKDTRIASRVSQKLVDQARAATGVTSDTELIELGLACLALEENSGKVLARNWGSVDPDTDFGI